MISKLLNKKIDFGLEHQDVTENLNWLPVIPLKDGKYSDVGLRFRLNEFEAHDHWLPGVNEKTQRFFDVITYNSDTFNAPSG